MLETDYAAEKAYNANKRAMDAGDFSSTDKGQGIIKGLHAVLSAHIQDNLDQNHTGKSYEQALVVIRDLGADRIALVGLTAAIHSTTTPGLILNKVAIYAGRLLETECWHQGLIKHDSKLERAVRLEANRTRNTVGRSRSIAARRGYRVPNWRDDRRAVVGGWLMGRVLECFPDWFVQELDEDGNYRLLLTQWGDEQAEDLIRPHLPVHMPRSEPPPAWTGLYMRSGDPDLDYSRTQFVRTYDPRTLAAVREAMANGQLKPAMDAVNALQGVPWRINRRVYETILACVERGIKVEGLPDDLDLDEDPDASFYERRALRILKAELKSEKHLFKWDMRVAKRHLDAPFWTAANLDWRGRVYPLPHCINFQREDRVRALFQFSDGMPIGEDGIKWLSIHLANVGGFHKIDKAPMAERLTWVTRHMRAIKAIARDPIRRMQWTKADKPWQFLAACFEMATAIAEGTTFVTRLPVAFDGSCSGLQHLSAMTRDDATGSLVNLIPTEKPSDIYTAICEGTRATIATDAANDPKWGKLAGAMLPYINRKAVKRNTMTFCYGSQSYGMQQQQQEDFVEKELGRQARKDGLKHPLHPWHFRGTEGKPSAAARYLGKAVNKTIQSRLDKPAEAMRYLQAISRAMSHESKPMQWVTPVGLPWRNGVYELECRRVRLYLGGKSPVLAKVATGTNGRVNKSKSANGSAPNFVHALDASHLMLVVNACASEGITNIATVHDSFGCLAPQATRFNEIIREQLVAMYTKHDVLQEILDAAKRDLTEPNWNRLPAMPAKGSLDLGEITRATYAFA